MNRFNRLFQKSSENTTCELYVEMNRCSTICSKCSDNEAILEANDNLTLLNFDAINQLSDQNLGIGDNTWIALALVEQEHDTKSFFASIRNFTSHLLRKC